MKPFHARVSAQALWTRLLIVPLVLSSGLLPAGDYANAATITGTSDVMEHATASHPTAKQLALSTVTNGSSSHSATQATDAPIINSRPITTEQQQLSFPQDFWIEQDIVALPQDRVLFVDRLTGDIYLNDLQTGSNLWSHQYEHIYSYRALPSSGKLVLIIQNKQHLQKLVLGSKGETLSTFNYPASLLGSLSDHQLSSYQISWSAPLQQGEKERIAIQQQDEVRIYESPWKKPLRTYKLKALQNHTLKDIHSTHMEYQSDRLVIQYAAGSLMQTEQIFEMLNTSSTSYQGKVIEIPWNLQSDFQLENGQAVIYSYSTKHPPLGPNGATSYPIYRRYDVATGKLLVEKTYVFKAQEPLWTTEYSNGQLLLSDRDEDRMSLYDKQGKELWQLPQLSDDIRLRLIKYENKLLYLLIETKDRQFKLVKQPLI